jgi:hypothetical protein
MKNLLVSVIALILLNGCGGGGSGSADQHSQDFQPTSNMPKNFDGYILRDYLSPKSSQKVTIYKYKNGDLIQEEKLSYEVGDANVKVKSLTNLGGKIFYYYPNDHDERIDVSIYENESENSFSMNNYIHLNDIVTTKGGECRVSKHFDEYKPKFDNHSFKDVLEIDCPNSVGFYQRDKGLVLEDIKSDLESNDLEYLPDFKDREIVNVDKSNGRLGVLNLDSAKEAKADILWEEPYNLNGEGMKVGLVDAGRVLSTHVELRGNVSNLSNAPLNKHATHTAGTIISKGVHLPSSRGFAKEAKLYALDYHKLYFADAVRELLNYGVLISNHSYGFEGAEGLGLYDSDSYQFDKLIKGNPYIIAMVAAGNDGRRYKRDSDFTKWGLIKGGANAKNVITVASVDNDNGVVSDFSSRGPIKGGRLKPDIALDGFNVLSTVVNPNDIDNDSYGRMYGTSMATPAVTGTIVLLSQRYKQINGANPRVDTIKAIIFNTAKDIENPGPDYKSGYGQLDAYEAVKAIDSMNSSNSLVKLDSIIQNEHLIYRFKADEYQKFKVTIAWVDGVAEHEELVDDIDIYLEDEYGNKVYPYTLDEFHPDRNAVQSRPNHLDPQEQIEALLEPGVRYTLHILGGKIPNSQDFTLVSNIPLPRPKTNMKIAPMRVQIHDIYESIREN